MANFVFSAELRGDARSLKGELASVQGEAKKTSASLRGIEDAGEVAEAGARELRAELARLRTGMDQVAAAEVAAARGMARGFDLRGPMLQLSQVSQQAMATGNAIGALAIQLPDMAMGFGPWGIAAGVAAGALLPLAANALAAGDAVKSLDEELEEVKGALDALRDVQETFSLEGIRELRDLYGEVNAEVLLLTERQRQALMGQAVREATEAVAALKAELSGNLFQTVGQDIAEAFSVEGFVGFRNAYAEEAREAAAQVREIEAAIDAVGQAEGFDAQADAVSALLGYMDDAGLQATVLYQRLTDAEAALRQVNAEASGLQGWLGAAVSGANSFAAALWDAAVAGLAASQAQSAAPMRPRPRPDDIDFGHTPPEPPMRPRPRPANAIDAGLPPTVRRGSSAGGGGGGARGGGGGGGRSAAASEAEREAEAVERLLEKLREEQAILHEADPLQRELRRLRDELSGATASQRAEVEALIRSNVAEEASIERLQDAMGDLRDAGGEALGSIVRGLAEGSSRAEIMADAVGRLADRFLDKGIDGLSNVLFGNGGSDFGLLGNLFAGMMGGVSGARAAGGEVWPGGAFLVGERGPELFMPPGPGRILPNGGRGGGFGGGDGPINLNVTVNVPCATTDRDLDQRIRTGVSSAVNQALGAYDQRLPDRVNGIQRDPRKR